MDIGMQRSRREAVLEWIQSLGYSVRDINDLADGSVLYGLLTTFVPESFPLEESLTLKVVHERLQEYLRRPVDFTIGNVVEEIICVMVSCREKNSYISKLLELSDDTQKTMMAIIQRRMSDDERKTTHSKKPARRATMQEGTPYDRTEEKHAEASERSKVKELKEALIAMSEERDKCVEEIAQLKEDLQAAVEKQQKDRRKLENLREKTKDQDREKSKQFDEMHLELRLQIDAANLRIAEAEKMHSARIAQMEDELDLARNDAQEAQSWKQRHEALQKRIDRIVHERTAQIETAADDDDMTDTSAEVCLRKKVETLEAQLREAESEIEHMKVKHENDVAHLRCAEEQLGLQKEKLALAAAKAQTQAQSVGGVMVHSGTADLMEDIDDVSPTKHKRDLRERDRELHLARNQYHMSLIATQREHQVVAQCFHELALRYHQLLLDTKGPPTV